MTQQQEPVARSPGGPHTKTGQGKGKIKNVAGSVKVTPILSSPLLGCVACFVTAYLLHIASKPLILFQNSILFSSVNCCLI
jgi:hypothetical protein